MIEAAAAATTPWMDGCIMPSQNPCIIVARLRSASDIFLTDPDEEKEGFLPRSARQSSASDEALLMHHHQPNDLIEIMPRSRSLMESPRLRCRQLIMLWLGSRLNLLRNFVKINDRLIHHYVQLSKEIGSVK